MRDPWAGSKWDALQFGDGQRFEVAQTGLRPSDRESLRVRQRRATLSPHVRLTAPNVLGGIGIIFLLTAALMVSVLVVYAQYTATGLVDENYLTIIGNPSYYSDWPLISVIGATFLLVAVILWLKRR